MGLLLWRKERGDLAFQIRIFRVGEPAGVPPANVPVGAEDDHVCAAIVGDMETLLPEILIPIRHEGPILHGLRHTGSHSGDGHWTKERRRVLQQDDSVNREIAGEIFRQMLIPLAGVSGRRAAEGEDQDCRLVAGG